MEPALSTDRAGRGRGRHGAGPAARWQQRLVHGDTEGTDVRGATHIPLAASVYLMVSNLVSLAPPPTHWIPEIATISTHVVEDIVSVTLPLIGATAGALLPDLERPGGTIRGVRDTSQDQHCWLYRLSDVADRCRRCSLCRCPSCHRGWPGRQSVSHLATKPGKTRQSLGSGSAAAG